MGDITIGSLVIDGFLVRAFAAGIALALVSGVLGCFVVWKRMAYFGDSLAHSALLGVALGLLVGIQTQIGIVIVCGAFAIGLIYLQQKNVLASDTLLGILAHSALSIGLIAISLMDHIRVDLHAYLFGDILTVTKNDLYWSYGGGAVVLALLLWKWSDLTLMTIHEDLARAEGVNTLWANILLMLVMTLVVATSLHIVGILLITSLLIIPAATARLISKSPEGMAITASLLGMAAVTGGLYASMQWDTPSGPSIVTAAAVVFLLVTVGKAVGSRQ